MMLGAVPLFDGEMTIGFLCVGAVVMAVTTLVGSVVLRAAVHFYHKLSGEQPPPAEWSRSKTNLQPPRPAGEAHPGNSAVPAGDSANPYAPPVTPLKRPERTTTRNLCVPTPRVGQALGISFLRQLLDISLVFGIESFRAQLVPAAWQQPGQGPTDVNQLLSQMYAGNQLPVTLLTHLASFFIGAVILKSILPTTFGKACLVQVLEYLIWLTIAAAIFGVAMLTTLQLQ